MLFAMRQDWWVQRNGVFVRMTNFTLLKGEGCLDSVVEKAIMKMQKKNSMAHERLSRAVYRFSARLRISTYQLHAGMIFTTLFLPIG